MNWNRFLKHLPESYFKPNLSRSNSIRKDEALREVEFLLDVEVLLEVEALREFEVEAEPLRELGLEFTDFASRIISSQRHSSSFESTRFCSSSKLSAFIIDLRNGLNKLLYSSSLWRSSCGKKHKHNQSVAESKKLFSIKERLIKSWKAGCFQVSTKFFDLVLHQRVQVLNGQMRTGLCSSIQKTAVQHKREFHRKTFRRKRLPSPNRPRHSWSFSLGHLSRRSRPICSLAIFGFINWNRWKLTVLKTSLMSPWDQTFAQTIGFSIAKTLILTLLFAKFFSIIFLRLSLWIGSTINSPNFAPYKQS